VSYLLHGLLQGSARAHPDRVALVDGDRQITYRELEALTNQIAHLLARTGVGKGDRVGLYLRKSLEAVAGAYGIMKAGAAYVPLDPEAPVVLFTAHATIQTAVEAIKAGAFDYITKPFTADQLQVVIERALTQRRLQEENRRLKEQLQESYRFENIIGRSLPMLQVFEVVKKVARSEANVLIVGESGTGKELVARSIHVNSARAAKPFIPVDCASLPENLLESELFGHEKGAFTGAHASHEGYFERADASSLLLDEVDSMPGRMQVALLRVLETGEYRPVGAASTRKSDFRLISAALPRLLTMVDAGQFRQDLFYRISALRIEIPPLRDRDADSQEIAVAHARSLGYRLTGGALRVIEKYDWPGNVRQLRHGIQAASLHAHDGRIGEAAIADVIAGYRGAPVNGGSEDPRALDSAWGRALRSLERVGKFGASDFAQAAALSRRSAQRHIAQLLQDGRIVRVGAGRATRYRVGADRQS